MSTELAGRTPYTRRSVVHRARVQRHGDGGVLVNLAAPLAEEEMGAFGQQQLRRWYASDEHRLDPDAVYLQSYTGAAATDSPLAIHRALRTLRPDLQLLWAVADRSTVVPEGARPLLMRSREWYAALARSRYLVTNVDMDTWFVKRPGQRLLQTYHGYPSKTMGLAAWRAKNFTPLRVERQLARTSGTWDLLLTPTPAMDVHYRREYRYEGEILATGYPRDDVLVGPEAGRIRADTRTRLGVGDGQRVVLYAPTWRDDLATNFRAAAMPATFDVEAAAAALGDGFVLLLRGHRFHRRRPVVGGRILDVTDYPEVNDLVLAADAAVLDYSSLRFDFALTGRPMVFLVPDLDRYATGVRGFLFDFRSSAPGPLVSSTHEVVERLRDVDALTRACQADLDRFNSEFNPLQDGHAAARVVDAFFGPPHDTP
jgi:CDP-glycerol glycerophosphotransferase